MFFYLFCFLSVISLLIIPVVSDGYDGAWNVFVCFLMSLFFGCFPICSIVDHSSDLAYIRKGQLLVDVQEQSLKDIDDQLAKIKIPQTALMNADSPAKSLIEAKYNIVKDLAQSRIKIAEAKISIEARSIGIMRPVVKWYGKE